MYKSLRVAGKSVLAYSDRCIIFCWTTALDSVLSRLYISTLSLGSGTYRMRLVFLHINLALVRLSRREIDRSVHYDGLAVRSSSQWPRADEL